MDDEGYSGVEYGIDVDVPTPMGALKRTALHAFANTHQVLLEVHH